MLWDVLFGVLYSKTQVHQSKLKYQLLMMHRRNKSAGPISGNNFSNVIPLQLVAGAFDMEARFTIDDAANIERMLQLLQIGDLSFQVGIVVYILIVTRNCVAV